MRSWLTGSRVWAGPFLDGTGIKTKLLPLGATKEGSGHKGSGLALWVDIMCGVLSMRGFHGHTTDPGEVNHFFGSWKIEAFGPLDEYPIAGKTGTAELEGGDLNHAWFVAYGPTPDPQYVVSVFVERAGHGG